jgi:hypothetical protein
MISPFLADDQAAFGGHAALNRPQGKEWGDFDIIRGRL